MSGDQIPSLPGKMPGGVDGCWSFDLTGTLCSSRKPYWKILASKTLNIRKEVNPSFCFAVLILHQKTFVWNCKPLVIDYVMYALLVCIVLLTWKRLFIWDLCTSIWRPDICNFYLLVPFLKNWPLKKVFRGHFGIQVKLSGWNTVKSDLGCF